MDAFLSIMPERIFFKNVIVTKYTVLPEINSKEAGKVFLIKIKNKLLLQTSYFIK